MVSHQLTISLDEDAFRALEKRAQSERRTLEGVAASMLTTASKLPATGMTSLEGPFVVGQIVTPSAFDPTEPLVLVRGIYYRYRIAGKPQPGQRFVVTAVKDNVLTLTPTNESEDDA